MAEVKDEAQRKIYCVYKHVCPDQSVYVGQAKGIPSIRWGNCGSGYNSQRFGEAVKKFGWKNIEHYLYHPSGWVKVSDDKSINNIYWLTQDEADYIENTAIISLDSVNNGWNVRKGSSNITAISEPPAYDDARTKLTLSIKEKDSMTIKVWAIRNHISVSQLFVDMFYELHGSEI